MLVHRLVLLFEQGLRFGNFLGCGFDVVAVGGLFRLGQQGLELGHRCQMLGGHLVRLAFGRLGRGGMIIVIVLGQAD